jgi:uncharacterized protein YodC (DUF2158 family)
VDAVTDANRWGEKINLAEIDHHRMPRPATTHNVGDVVRLNSGSPMLTVDGLSHDGYIEVTWLDDGRTEQHSAFPAACLRGVGRSFWRRLCARLLA